ncbi:MAG: hypothetical protein MJ186_06365 [Clostridia bacterium]|nr:hypothetical protein [Clostridia bacterium]
MRIAANLWILFWLAAAARRDLKTLTIPPAAVLAIAAAAPWAGCAGPGARLMAAGLPLILIPCMGMGDVKLYSALGLSLGPAPLLRIGALSMLLGGLYAFMLLILGLASKKDRFAFGPFIAAAAAYYIILDLIPI